MHTFGPSVTVVVHHIFILLYYFIHFFFMSSCTERVYFAPVYRYIPISTFCPGRGITVFSKFRTLRPHCRRHSVYRHDNTTDHIVYIALPVFTGLTDFNSDLLVAFFIGFVYIIILNTQID